MKYRAKELIATFIGSSKARRDLRLKTDKAEVESATTRQRSIKEGSGFSMLEVLVVVAISLTLGTMAIPQAVRTLQRLRLNTTSRELMSTVEAARFVAIMRQGVFGAQIENTRHTFEVVQWDTASASWQPLSISGRFDSFASRKEFNPKVTLAVTGLGPANIIAFNGKGELMNSAGAVPVPYTSGLPTPTITLATETGTCDVVFSRFGQVKVVQHGTSKDD
jgi:prepilin-type N-terminal cleavage/methylation domain-containing protein